MIFRIILSLIALSSFLFIGQSIANETNKQVFATFSGKLNDASNVATDVTPNLVNCMAWSQDDCFIILSSGEKVNSFGTGGASSQNLKVTPGMVGRPFTVKFDASTKPVVLTRSDGMKVDAYFKVIGVSFQINAVAWGAFSYKLENIFTYPDGTSWLANGGTYPTIQFTGDCTTGNSFVTPSSNNLSMRIFTYTNKEGFAICPSTNMYFNPAAPTNGDKYNGQNAFFIYRLTTDDVRKMEPGVYTTSVPIRYTIGQGESIDLYEGTVTQSTLKTAHNVNIQLTVTHDIKITGSVSKIKLYPGTPVNWEKWKITRTPLSNDIFHSLASTGPVRVSVFCKDYITAGGLCAMRRRLPNDVSDVGAVDPSDSRLYAVKLFLTQAGFVDYYTRDSIQNVELTPSTVLPTSTRAPTSSVTIVPLGSYSNPGSLLIMTAPNVAESMESGRTYAGSITLVFEPGQI